MVKNYKFECCLLVITLLIFMSGNFTKAFAQAQEKISSARPDQTQNTVTIKPNVWQFETGFLILRDKAGTEKNRKMLMPEFIIRTGLTDWMELGADMALQSIKFEDEYGSDTERGLGPLRVSPRVRFWEGNGLWPAVAMQALVILPVGDKRFIPDNPETELVFILTHELGSKVQLAYNVAYTWLDHENKKSYAINLAIELSEKFSVYTEVYGSKQKFQNASHELGTGVLYLIHPNLQLDLAGALGLTKSAPDYFVTSGISLRLPR